MNYQAASDYILHRLRTQLSPSLSYHGVHHTLDVLQTAQALAEAEGITDEASLILLQTAACFHDAGFLTTYEGHEEQGCLLVREVLPGFGYLPEQLEMICSLIMATQIPQSPKTHLERILCDADLDYLGRDDFAPIADSLFQELRTRGSVTDTPVWNRIQVKFLENHRYWTPTAIARRQAGKEQQLAALRTLVEAETN
jgi:predicted metal-dependent HD superfamily phosphohydrolase